VVDNGLPTFSRVDAYDLLRSLHKTIAAVTVWNMLPPAIMSLPSLQTFKRALETEPFHRSYDNAH